MNEPGAQGAGEPPNLAEPGAVPGPGAEPSIAPPVEVRVGLNFVTLPAPVIVRTEPCECGRVFESGVPGALEMARKGQELKIECKRGRKRGRIVVAQKRLVQPSAAMPRGRDG